MFQPWLPQSDVTTLKMLCGHIMMSNESKTHIFLSPFLMHYLELFNLMHNYGIFSQISVLQSFNEK